MWASVQAGEKMRVFNTLILFLAACAPEYEDAPVKLVGIGYNPDEIGPAPTPYGGVVEYSRVNFAGGGLSLALMSLGSFDEVGPSFVGFAPPFQAVYGFSYFFDTKLSAADSLGGVTSVPPEKENTCYTTFQASGPIGSFNTVDVGSYMEFRTADGLGGFRMDRLPGDYPANMQDLYIYYSGLDFYQPLPYPSYTGQSDYELVRPANFPLGQSVEFRFPGGLAPKEAPVSSLPQPSTAVGNTVFQLPTDLGPVLLTWNGPRLDGYGNPIPVENGESGPQATCLNYYMNQSLAPTQAADCVDGEGQAPDYTESGQTYTGPWDTEDGKVVFHWVPTGDPGEIVSLSVRFLGPVDRDDPNWKEYIVRTTANEDVQANWDKQVQRGSIPDSVDIPEGRRAPAPCEEGEWVFDNNFETATTQLAPPLQGDPFNNMAEVTCRLEDTGSFELTNDVLAEAVTFARSHGAEGAVFYLARSTENEVVVPPAMNSYEQRLEISPIKLTSRVIDIGRFYFDGE